MRRKTIVDAAVERLEYWPVPPLSIIDLIKNPPKRIHFEPVKRVNNTIVLGLQADWPGQILLHFPRELTRQEVAQLELALNTYIHERTARLHPITWSALRSRFERIAELSGALLNELNDWPPTYAIAWKRITRISELHGQSRLSHDNVYPIVSHLHGSCFRALEEAKQERASGKKGDYRAPWIALVGGLRELFEQSGGRATAAKNLRGGVSAKPSPFVELIWSVMTGAIPKSLREHTHTKAAMANQISRALATLRHKT